jgi:hypothetical protein
MATHCARPSLGKQREEMREGRGSDEEIETRKERRCRERGE